MNAEGHKEVINHIMSVPKVKSVSSPQHVSDRLRRSKNTRLESSSETGVFAIYNPKTRCFQDTNSIHNNSKTSRIEKSIELPDRIMKLILTPCEKKQSRCGDVIIRSKLEMKMTEIYLEVINDLKRDAKELDDINSLSDNGIVKIINDCFQITSKTSSISLREKQLSYAKNLAVECIEIIERVVSNQRLQFHYDTINYCEKNPRKRVKTLLLNTMLGIERELINSEKILEMVDTEWHSQSFRFIYSLLKHYMVILASRLKFGDEDYLMTSNLDIRSGKASGFLSDSTASSNQMIEECSNRLNKLLEQWTATGASIPDVISSRQLIVDSSTENKDREMILKTVSQYTEEMKKILQENGSLDDEWSGSRSDKRATLNIEKVPNDSTRETTAFYSWSMTGKNPCQFSNFDRINIQRSCCSSNYDHHSSSSIKVRRQPFRDHNNCNSCQPHSQNRHDQCTISSPVTEIYCRPHHQPPMKSCKIRSTTQPLFADNTIHSLVPTLGLQPFPKLKLPNLNTDCKTIGAPIGYHKPQCSIPSDRLDKLCCSGNETWGNNCDKFWDRSNQKPPYFHKFPGFQGKEFSDSKFVNAFQPQTVEAFSVSPAYEESNAAKTTSKGKKKDKKSADEASLERKNDKSQKTQKSGKKTTSLEGEKNANSPSTNDNDEQYKLEQQTSPSSTNAEQKSKKDVTISKNEENKDMIANNRSEVPVSKGPSHINSSKSVESNKPSRNESSNVNDRDKPAQSTKINNENGKNQDGDHCTCCKCLKTNGKDGGKPAFVCHCNGVDNHDTSGCMPIFQFFATPMTPCSCHKKADICKKPSEVQIERSPSPHRRDSQDAETQTRKKPNVKSDTSMPLSSEPSTGPISSEPSKNDQEPQIEQSETCTCSVVFSRTSSHHGGDPKSDSRLSGKCPCPQDIESIFQNFDDKYSKCVQEIKLLIKEGYIPRIQGSDDSFTVTHEITVTPSRSKSACKDDSIKPSQKQRLQFHEDQDHNTEGSRVNEIHHSNLRDDIEELKRLVKQHRGGCPCCKCCKCEKEGKGDKFEECLKDSKNAYSNQPAAGVSEPSANREKPRKRYTSAEIEESNKEPPKGSKVITLSPGFVEPELPPSVQELITPPQNEATKAPSAPPIIDPKNKKSQDQIKGKYQPGTDTKKVENTSKQGISTKAPVKQQQPLKADVKPKSGDYDPSEISANNATAVKTSETGESSVNDGFPGSYNDDGRRSSITNTKLSFPVEDQNKGVSGQKTVEEVPSIEKEGEYTDFRQDIIDKEGLRWEDGIDTFDDSKKSEIEFIQRENERNKQVSRQQESFEGNVIDTKPKTVYSNDSKRPKQEKEYDEEKEKPELSLEKKALDQSREHLFDKSKNNSNPQDGEAKKGWNPLDSIFGVFGERTKEDETSSVGERKLDKGETGKSEPSFGMEKPNERTNRGMGKPNERTDRGMDRSSGNESMGTPNERTNNIGIDRSSGNRSMGKPNERTNRDIDKPSGNKSKGKRNDGGNVEGATPERDVEFGSRSFRENGKFEDKAKRGQSGVGKSSGGMYEYGDGGNFEGAAPKKSVEFGGTSSKEKGSSEDKTQRGQSGVRKSSGGTLEDGNNFHDETSKATEQKEQSEKYAGKKTNSPCRDDDDDDDYDEDYFTYSDSCADSNPCWSSSSCSSDECTDIFNDLPCTFYSEESNASSISEVIKETEAELYVMIIESQAPVSSSLADHSKILSLLLSSNNDADVMGYKNTEFSRSRNTNSRVQLKTTKKSNTDAAHQNNIEIVSLHSSYDGSDGIELSSNNLQSSRHSTSFNYRNEMKERNSSNLLQPEGKIRRKSSRDLKPDEKKRPSHKERKDSGVDKVQTVEPLPTIDKEESLNINENKEVQVTKWNAKVQTAGPRKFNRTDIPRDVEDKLATYLGLERTAEQMDLKIIPTQREASNQLESDKRISNRKERQQTSSSMDKNRKNDQNIRS